jgi:hypothetical protein
MRTTRTIVACLAMLTASVSNSETLTAVCSNPKGWGVGYETGKPDAGEDGFRDATFTYTWKIGESTATLVTQNSKSAGGAPSTETATVVASHGFVTFLVMYPQGIWMHTLFPRAGVAMISRHTTGRGLFTDSAEGALFHSNCKISVN